VPVGVSRLSSLSCLQKRVIAGEAPGEGVLTPNPLPCSPLATSWRRAGFNREDFRWFSVLDGFADSPFELKPRAREDCPTSSQTRLAFLYDSASRLWFVVQRAAQSHFPTSAIRGQCQVPEGVGPGRRYLPLIRSTSSALLAAPRAPVADSVHRSGFPFRTGRRPGRKARPSPPARCNGCTCSALCGSPCSPS